MSALKKRRAVETGIGERIPIRKFARSWVLKVKNWNERELSGKVSPF
jgi:hypothetical protein